MKYFLKRILITIPIFLGITIIVYFMAAKAPGTPLQMLIGNQTASLTEVDRLRMEAQLGLDQPVIVQYFRWLGQLFRGNFGISMRSSQPVWDSISARLGATLLLSISSLLFSIIIAIPLGAIAAYKPYSVWDYTATGLSFVGTSTPNFFAAMILIYFFAVKLGWLPTGGMYDISSDRSTLTLLRHLILPMITMMIQQIGAYIRHMRSAMIEALEGDYIRTARSKGMHEGKVIFTHALRNSLIPIVTQIGLSLPGIVGGAVITEQIFGWPGIGSLLVLSINYRDYPTIMGITVFIAAVVLIGNILVDLIYGVLDPRIRSKKGLSK